MLKLKHVTKYFGRAQAIKDLNIECSEREFLVIFGPAGAGKSTTLRLIAGISPMDSGEIWYDGHNLAGVPPEHRNMAMAFENYALYSHLSVYNNLAFPLRARKFTKTEIDKKVREMAALLQITPLLDRRPGQMSGGQRQRVALGRTLIREADVYLLDEPISHLDAKLRHHMRTQLKAMCSAWDATMVYVTHDYKEAMALSDRIAVLNKGRLMQIGKPEEIFHKPANDFVAGFMGDPPMSFLQATVHVENGRSTLQSGAMRIPINDELQHTIQEHAPAGNVKIGIRATDIAVLPQESHEFNVPAEVYVTETFGYRNIITCRAPDSDLFQVVSAPEINFNVKETAWLKISGDQLHLFAPEGKAIAHPRQNNYVGGFE